MKWYFTNLLIAFDQLLNAFAGGWCDETISSRSHRRRMAGCPALANVIDAVAWCFGDMNHCKESYESERAGRWLPPELRKKV